MVVSGYDHPGIRGRWLSEAVDMNSYTCVLGSLKLPWLWEIPFVGPAASLAVYFTSRGLKAVFIIVVRESA